MKKAVTSIIISVFALVASGYGLLELMNSRSLQLFGGLVVKVETNEQVLALTIDDGPGENTDEILKILREEDVKATFFLTGQEIEENMAYAEKIVQDGHEIGNHSYSHQRMVFKTPAFIKEEIEKTDELIRQAGYQGEIHFRPPFGKRLILLPYYLNHHERKTILWNIEPESYPEIAMDADKIIDYVVENIEPGSIILLHVMYESRRESLNAVKGIITALKEQGYTFTTVSELLNYRN
ncbi:chitin deacetylase [Caldalkalibacillus uzonensis]|uniref:Chitin deacetylase n=1 Tax=Caldalkalibacillus uzonensis TaxID=353224 RepID=A0ABU0CWL7_9BACI|nr:polysaccharide deacetylase family protein [Caldalkalibacillus uzonensis]MDQ0340503.1 chitin deacetylase [Caldalkalibacillus uzonensis]